MNKRFVFKSSLPTLNEYIQAERGYWAAAAALKKKATGNIQIEAMSQSRKKIEGMVDIDIFWVTPDNKQDADNVFFGIKFILDGLVKAGILSSDGRKNVRHISNFIRTVKGKRFITVTIKQIKDGKCS